MTRGAPPAAGWLIVCAWCGRAKDAAGDPVEGIPPRAPDSHGICNACAVQVKQEIDAARSWLSEKHGL